MLGEMSDRGSIYFLALIPAMGFFLTWLLSNLSGWSRLAQTYRDRGECRSASLSETARFRTGRLGAVNYHSVLTFVVCETGLGIRVPLLFRLGHPPLFIPWSEFYRVSDDPMLYSHRVKASIGNPTIVRLTLPGWVKYRLPLELRETTVGQ